MLAWSSVSITYKVILLRSKYSQIDDKCRNKLYYIKRDSIIINLESSGCTANDKNILSDILKNCKEVKRIILSNNKFGEEGLKNLI